MLDRTEPTGLVCGYRIRTSGKLEEIDWTDMDAAIADPDSIVWLHFNLADARARAWIGAAHISSAAKAILLGQDRHMRLELCGEAIAGVVCDLHHEFAERPEDLEVLRLYLDTRCLISARRKPLAAMDKLRHSIGEGLQVERPVRIISHFLHHVTDTLGHLLIELSEDVDDMEDVVLSGRMEDQSPELARIRRITVRLRRHMVPQQHALLGLAARMPQWIAAEDAVELRTAIERLGALGHDLDLVQDRSRVLADQLAGRLMEATNRNLYILSIVTTVFLPMTLVTGIFGMNLGGLPWQQDPRGFGYGMAIMLALGITAFFLLRRRRMF